MISRQPTPDGFVFFVFEVEDPVVGLEIQIQAQEAPRFLVAFNDISHAVGNKVSFCHLGKITLAINAAAIRDRNESFELGGKFISLSAEDILWEAVISCGL